MIVNKENVQAIFSHLRIKLKEHCEKNSISRKDIIKAGGPSESTLNGLASNTYQVVLTDGHKVTPSTSARLTSFIKTYRALGIPIMASLDGCSELIDLTSEESYIHIQNTVLEVSQKSSLTSKEIGLRSGYNKNVLSQIRGRVRKLESHPFGLFVYCSILEVLSKPVSIVTSKNEIEHAKNDQNYQAVA